MQRRQFLQTGAAAGAGLASWAALGAAPAHADQGSSGRGRGSGAEPHISWTIFTRHLQWLTTQAESQADPYATGVLIGEKAAELGYPAVNLTVRRGGHVDPSLVDVRKNLPLALKGIRSTGVACSFITTDIVDSESPVATLAGSPVLPADVLQVARDQGIDIYRWGGFTYDYSADPATGEPQPFGDEVLDQLDVFRKRVKGLAKLNKKLGVTAAYHTHTSSGRGARSVWDLMYMLRDYEPEELGINFDIGHMTNEGTLSSWRTNVRYAMPYIRSVGLKDTLVERTPNGTVASTWQLAGTGMVQWREFFQLLREGGFSGPGETHYEYNVVGLNGQTASLNTTFWSDHPHFASGNLTPGFMTEELKKDLVTYRAQALAAGWRADQLT